MSSFFPPPEDGSVQGSNKTVQIKTKLATVSTELPKECSTEGSRAGGKEESREGAQVQKTYPLFPPRFLCPLPGSIMPANTEVQLWARRVWIEKNSQSLGFCWEEKIHNCQALLA